MKLTDVIQVRCVKPHAAFEDKAMALCEIAAMASRSVLSRNVSEEMILEALQDRETLGSTAFGNGVAIPHCKLKHIQNFIVGAISVPDGVDFESADGKKVRLIVFIIAPTTDSVTHVRLLSSISRALQDTEAVKKMVAAQTPQALIEQFIQAAQSDIAVEEPGKKNLMTITIQDKTVFEKILGALAGIDGVSLAILDSQSAHPALKSIPLFAAATEANHPIFCKQISAVIERNLGNEMIRRIESITGSLSECSGILVTMQELSFCAGMLES